MSVLALQLADADAFRPFGRFLAPARDGKRVDHRDLVRNLRPNAVATVAVVKADDHSSSRELVIRRMERHPFSTQTFFPVEVESYLVVVAASGPGGGPDPSTITAFAVPGDVATHYEAGAWHLGIGALAGAGLFGMLVHEDGGPDDCEFQDIPPITVALHELAPLEPTR